MRGHGQNAAPQGGSRMGTFRAMVIDKADSDQNVGLRDFDEADLMDGDVTVRVTHSTLN
jgi:acrylyl-CoA reductase (NADPH)